MVYDLRHGRIEVWMPFLNAVHGLGMAEAAAYAVILAMTELIPGPVAVDDPQLATFLRWPPEGLGAVLQRLVGSGHVRIITASATTPILSNGRVITSGDWIFIVGA